MRNIGKLTLTTPTDREIVMTRVFDAPRDLVYLAMTRPDLMKRWFYGPPGWSLSVCEMDLREGGAYRWVWRHEKGHDMGVGGIYREVVPGVRLVATERFDEAWYPGEALVTTALAESGGRTTLNLTVRYESREARDVALKTPMEEGVALCYDRLEEIVASMGTSGSRT